MGGRVVAAMALLAVLLGVWRRVPVYDAFVRGARTGLRTAVSIAPALLAVLPAAAALTASGATDALCALLSPALSALRLPEQAVPLMLLRPLSGAGALGIWIFILLERLLIRLWAGQPRGAGGERGCGRKRDAAVCVGAVHGRVGRAPFALCGACGAAGVGGGMPGGGFRMSLGVLGAVGACPYGSVGV